ncbi:hypothetical protein MPQ_0706 [Methylovorus sp. MP688]|nr:hypothetical protein MPQ_0706 [Methylovorus sp. MP688]
MPLAAHVQSAALLSITHIVIALLPALWQVDADYGVSA